MSGEDTRPCAKCGVPHNRHSIGALIDPAYPDSGHVWVAPAGEDTREALVAEADALVESLRAGHLYGESNEPLDAYARRIVRVIELRLRTRGIQAASRLAAPVGEKPGQAASGYDPQPAPQDLLRELEELATTWGHGKRANGGMVSGPEACAIEQTAHRALVALRQRYGPTDELAAPESHAELEHAALVHLHATVKAIVAENVYEANDEVHCRSCLPSFTPGSELHAPDCLILKLTRALGTFTPRLAAPVGEKTCPLCHQTFNPERGHYCDWLKPPLPAEVRRCRDCGATSPSTTCDVTGFACVTEPIAAPPAEARERVIDDAEATGDPAKVALAGYVRLADADLAALRAQVQTLAGFRQSNNDLIARLQEELVERRAQVQALSETVASLQAERNEEHRNRIAAMRQVQTHAQEAADWRKSFEFTNEQLGKAEAQVQTLTEERDELIGRVPTDAPPGDRLMLNAYGRRCWLEGYEQATAALIAAVEQLTVRECYTGNHVNRDELLAALRAVTPSQE